MASRFAFHFPLFKSYTLVAKYFSTNFLILQGYYLLTSPPKRRISVFPPPLGQTTMWQSGSSEIIMRKFEPADVDPSSTPSHLRPLEGVRENDEFFYRVSNVPKRSTYEDDYRSTEPQVELRAIADRKQAPWVSNCFEIGVLLTGEIW